MGPSSITFLWLWPATDHEPHCWHVSIDEIWRRTESTPRSRWWRSHMAGIYSDCSTREMNNWSSPLSCYQLFVLNPTHTERYDTRHADVPWTASASWNNCRSGSTASTAANLPSVDVEADLTGVLVNCDWETRWRGTGTALPQRCDISSSRATRRRRFLLHDSRSLVCR